MLFVLDLELLVVDLLILLEVLTQILMVGVIIL